MLDDPNSPVIFRTSGDGVQIGGGGGVLPREIQPRSVTLRDRVTQATLVPFSSVLQVPRQLVAYLCSAHANYVNGADLRIDGGAADCV